MRSLLRHLFVWLANRVPNFFCLKFAKALLLRLAGVKLDPLRLYYLSPIHMDRPANIKIGKGVFINRHCTFEGQGKVEIGDNVQIGPNVVFATTNHRPGDMKEVFGDIEIQRNVWIGAGVVVVPGVSIGPNVVVGAGSVVTKDFKNCVVAGVPARVIKKETHGLVVDEN